MRRATSLAPGYRTEIRRDWRSAAGAAVSAVGGDPASWLLGLAGFLARGGALVMALPILSVPSPVLLSLLFRGEVGAIGRGEIRLVALGVGLVLAVIAIAAIILSAWVEVALAERLVHQPATRELRLGRDARALSPAARRQLTWWVASIQAVALVPIVVVITIVLDAAVRVTGDELTGPSATDAPLAARVLGSMGGELMLLAAVVVLVEIAASLASRRLMAATWGLLPHGPDPRGEPRVAATGLVRLIRSPLRVIATAATGWAVLLLAIVPVAVASSVAWTAARDALIAGGVRVEPGVLLVIAFLVALFCAVWLAGLVLVGLAAAARAGLWTADALR